MTSSGKNVCVAVVGVGLVGGEFIEQLTALASPHRFRLVSITSSKATVLSPGGQASWTGWRQDLSQSTLKPDLTALGRQLSSLVKVNQDVVLVDNTSSEELASLYPLLLNLGINLITPNKKAFSSSLALYDDILGASLETGARFFNEATVGAGLPIISTLKDLIATGDKVVKIEGVLSGTLSYIFNEFSTGREGGPSFSTIVTTAREKGYTEPHPADDLNGADVARKLTILSRYIPALRNSLKDGYKSVNTRSLVPAALEGIATGDEFIRRLPEFDSEFEELRSGAFKEKQVLRFVGVIDVGSGLIKADLEKYPDTHPFATSLGGSDNIIMFHTERYGARPLIVQGAGAGAAVTAMGVLGDLLKLV